MFNDSNKKFKTAIVNPLSLLKISFDPSVFLRPLWDLQNERSLMHHMYDCVTQRCSVGKDPQGGAMQC